MKFVIRRWEDNAATLMTEMGHVLAYFPSLCEALTACEAWYFENSSEQRCEVKVLNYSDF